MTARYIPPLPGDFRPALSETVPSSKPSGLRYRKEPLSRGRSLGQLPPNSSLGGVPAIRKEKCFSDVFQLQSVASGFFLCLHPAETQSIKHNRTDFFFKRANRDIVHFGSNLDMLPWMYFCSPSITVEKTLTGFISVFMALLRVDPAFFNQVGFQPRPMPCVLPPETLRWGGVLFGPLCQAFLSSIFQGPGSSPLPVLHPAS